jgi:hypothetical protein
VTNKNLYLRFVLAMFIVAAVAVAGCSSSDDEATPIVEPEPTAYDREDFTPMDGPPPFPIIFEGKFTVNGEPGPADHTIYAEFIHGGSPRSTTFAGEYIQVILGPVSNDDIEHGVISFYLGTRVGDHVKAEETWSWNPLSSPTNQVLDLSFPRLPES